MYMCIFIREIHIYYLSRIIDKILIVWFDILSRYYIVKWMYQRILYNSVSFIKNGNVTFIIFSKSDMHIYRYFIETLQKIYVNIQILMVHFFCNLFFFARE